MAVGEDGGRGDAGDRFPEEGTEDGFTSLLEELSDEDLAELADEEDDAADGLDLDDVQSVEIRNIFLTTLPQYLEPVEEMLRQLLSTDPPDEQIRSTLVKTLESIHTAATRIGIDDVSIRIDRMCDRLAQLGTGDRPATELGDEVETELVALRRLSTSAGAEAGAAPEGGDAGRSRTIFAALSSAGEVDRAVLEKLTAAGLVTVDPLRMARLDELMAVTGLDRATVELVVRLAVGGADVADPSPEPEAPPPIAEAPPPVADAAAESHAPPPAAEAMPEAPPPVADAAAESGAPPPVAEAMPEAAPEPPGREDPDPATLEGDLARRLRKQVETEAANGELRAAILARRSEIASLRSRLEAARQGGADRREALTSAEERTVEALASIHGVRQERSRLEARLAEVEREQTALGSELARLRRDRRAAEEEQARLADALAELRAEVQRLLAGVPRD